MLKAEIIAVGTELLIGQIANTNAQYLSEKLNCLGIGVYYHNVVGDNLTRIVDTISLAFERSDYIFLTGGLGPTEDDITREAVAEFASLELIENTLAYEHIASYFKNKNLEMPKSNRKQALIPSGAQILENSWGTAPGFILPKDGRNIIVLPGPPREMTQMFENRVRPILFPNNEFSIYSKYLRVFGIGESLIEQRLIDLIDAQTSPTIATYAKEGECAIRLTSHSKTGSTIDTNALFEPVLGEILNRLGQTVYSTENKELHQATLEILKSKKLTLSVAESCTGGMICSRLTSIPGASETFLAGFVTYSNEAKTNVLGVNPQTLALHGAVSSQVAIEMAQGAQKRSASDIAISVTGIAGPGGGTSEKPVGLVFIGFCNGIESNYKELRLSGDREKIRNLTTLHALDMIRRYAMEQL